MPACRLVASYGGCLFSPSSNAEIRREFHKTFYMLLSSSCFHGNLRLQLGQSQVLPESRDTYDSNMSARGGLERTFVGLWMSLAGPHFCLEGSGFKSILLGCSEIFVREGASASSVPHLTFWKFLSPSFSTQTYLRKIKSNPRSQAWWYTPVFSVLGKQGRRIPSSRIARAA